MTYDQKVGGPPLILNGPRSLSREGNRHGAEGFGPNWAYQLISEPTLNLKRRNAVPLSETAFLHDYPNFYS